MHAVLRRYLPDELSAEKLAELERWRCDSRTAACACLLLLCATREALTDGAQAMALAKALTEVCSALGRHSAHDSMAWGCDLDPGNTGAQLSTPAGEMSSNSQMLHWSQPLTMLPLEVCLQRDQLIQRNTICALVCSCSFSDLYKGRYIFIATLAVR